MSLIYKGQTIADVGSGSGEVYSTEEQRIGTWIDGKPLYRKVIQGVGPTRTGIWQVIGSPIVDVDRVSKFDSYVYNSAGIYIPLPFIVWGTGTVSSLYDVVGNDGRSPGFNVFSNYSGIVDVPLLAVVEYTKTTDSGVTS